MADQIKRRGALLRTMVLVATALVTAGAVAYWLGTLGRG